MLGGNFQATEIIVNLAGGNGFAEQFAPKPAELTEEGIPTFAGEPEVVIADSAEPMLSLFAEAH